MPYRFVKRLFRLITKPKPVQDQLEKIVGKLTLVVLFSGQLEEMVYATLKGQGLRCLHVKVNKKNPESAWKVIIVYSMLDPKNCGGTSVIQETRVICTQLNGAYYKSGLRLWTPKTEAEANAAIELFNLTHEALRLV